MAIDINTLRARRKTNIEAIAKSFAEKGQKGQKQSYEDDRYWKLVPEKGGNGAALIRFLDITPESEDDSPHVLIWKYGFQHNGRWYIEKSLQSIGQQDPVYDLNGELFKLAKGNNTEPDKKSPFYKQMQNQRRVAEYHSNILVINDPANPDNNGKVFLFKYGNQIFKKIMAKIAPSEEDMAIGAEMVPIFDYWDGLNFRLVMKTEMVDFGKGPKPTPSYESSEFESKQKPVADSDEKIIAIAKQQHSLSELHDPKHFKTYEQLSKRLDYVLNGKKDTGETEGGGEEPTPDEEPSNPGTEVKSETQPMEGDADATEYLRSVMKKKK